MFTESEKDVLILVVVEDGLRVYFLQPLKIRHHAVLILVVVEDGLRVLIEFSHCLTKS